MEANHWSCSTLVPELSRDCIIKPQTILALQKVTTLSTRHHTPIASTQSRLAVYYNKEHSKTGPVIFALCSCQAPAALLSRAVRINILPSSCLELQESRLLVWRWFPHWTNHCWRDWRMYNRYTWEWPEGACLLSWWKAACARLRLPLCLSLPEWEGM